MNSIENNTINTNPSTSQELVKFTDHFFRKSLGLFLPDANHIEHPHGGWKSPAIQFQDFTLYKSTETRMGPGPYYIQEKSDIWILETSMNSIRQINGAYSGDTELYSGPSIIKALETAGIFLIKLRIAQFEEKISIKLAGKEYEPKQDEIRG